MFYKFNSRIINFVGREVFTITVFYSMSHHGQFWTTTKQVSTENSTIQITQSFKRYYPILAAMSFRVRLARSRPMRLLGSVALKCWAFSSVYLLICFLLYWLYGGILAFVLLCFATVGLYYFSFFPNNQYLFVMPLFFATGILYHREDQLLYHPELPAHSRVYVPAPSIFSLPYQSVYTRSGDGTMLHMFFVSQPKDRMKKVPTVLFLHGNAGNMGHRYLFCYFDIILVICLS